MLAAAFVEILKRSPCARFTHAEVVKMSVSDKSVVEIDLLPRRGESISIIPVYVERKPRVDAP